MGINLHETLNRLRGRRIGDSWWRNILNRIEHEYIAPPDFLNNSAVQEWLADDVVASDLKSLAKNIIVGGSRDDPDTRARLAGSWSSEAAQDAPSGTDVIDNVVAILAAGYIASVTADQLPVAAMLQESSSQMHERFDSLEEHLRPNSAYSEPPLSGTIQQLITHRTRQELSRILSLRAFDASRARSQIGKLLKQTKAGDLAAADNAIKIEVLYWAVRLYATDKETLPIAKQLRGDLRQASPDKELSILDALIAEKDGDGKKALRLLRDCNDPDARSVWLGLLDRLKGQQAAWDWVQEQDLHDDHLFAPVGWHNWGILAVKLQNWDEACLRLRKLENRWEEMPGLAFLEGIINAAMLLPREFRQEVLNGIPFFSNMSPNQDTIAQRHHSRATTCFEFVGRWLEKQGDVNPIWTKAIGDWDLWLRLMNPRRKSAQTARREVKCRMSEGADAVNAIRFAFVFNISFDERPLKGYLEQRKKLGGLDDPEVLAECFCNVTSMRPSDLVEYLEYNKTRVQRVLSSAFLARLCTIAFENAGQPPERMRERLGEYAGHLDKADLDRLLTFVDSYEGKDIREKLEARYRQTGGLIDLRNLISYLKMPDDRTALRPLTQELFNRAPTVEHAMGVIASLNHPSDFDHEEIIDFLERHADILEQSDGLKTVKAWALFRAGRLEESKEINDSVKSRRIHPDNLLLDFKITVASGQWERFGEVLERAWDQRGVFHPQDVMNFAHVARLQDQHDLALKFAGEAAKKAPDDPHILAAGYWLYLQLGREEEANLDWLQRATNLSSPAQGPIQLVSLEDIVTEFFPKRRDHVRKVERKWRAGEIPMSVAADALNVSVARVLLRKAHSNENEQDARRWVTIPIFAGRREPIQLQENWTIGLDVSSVLVLDYLGLLEKAINSFHHVKLAPNIMEHMLREQQEVRFHQPSRVREAQQVLALENQGQLALSDGPRMPPEAISDEVGAELGALLNMARQKNGKVVCTVPIHQAGSLTDQEADISGFHDLILPIADFCKLLHERGKIGTADYQRVRLFLGSRGQTETGEILAPTLLDGPVYMDDLALSYLLSANVLRPIAKAKQIGIHPDIILEKRLLVEAGDIGEELANKIDGMRRVLRQAMERGKASLLPHASNEDKLRQGPEIRFEATTSLLAGSDAYDALCIDDRYFNKQATFSKRNEEHIPITCVLDVLRHLNAQKVISDADYRAARHRLRQSGFAFIPPESDELIYWLREARFDEEKFVESVELRVMRQAAAHPKCRELPNWREGFALIQNFWSVCSTVIADLWKDQTLPSERVAALSSWVWHRMMAITIPRPQNVTASDYLCLIRELASIRLGVQLVRTPGQSRERQAGHNDWIKHVVLEPLQPANADLIYQSLVSVREGISTHGSNAGLDKVACGNFFLQSLPNTAQRIVADNDPEFMHKCGVRSETTFSIGKDVELEASKLFRAAKDLLRTEKNQRLKGLCGKEVLVALDEGRRSIVVNSLDTSSNPWSVEFPELALLSPDQKVRLEALRGVIEKVGPAAKDFRPLLREVKSRKLNEQELSEIFGERANGVAARQAGLIDKISRHLPFGLQDIFPSSVSYFERFCGPNPEGRGTEEYLQKVLIPYRKELLDRNFEVGLDICCLGALRDDLAPGAWVAESDKGILWKALSSCHPNSNPFSLLGALDIALYKQDDRRFREFASGAVDRLIDERFGQGDGADIFELLSILYYLTLNRMNLLENGANYPGYWKRMSAWMQTSLTVRAMAEASTPIHVDEVRMWAQDRMAAPGVYAELVDARKEPMLSASRMAKDLRNVVLGRLDVLRLRHEPRGSQGPALQRIGQALAQMQKNGRHPVWDFPGVLEDHKRPTRPLPKEFREKLDQAVDEKDRSRYWQGLAIASKLFALDAPILERAQREIRIIIESTIDKLDLAGTLGQANVASLVAAASRDTKLADAVAEATVAVCPKSSGMEVLDIVGTVLQAAAARKEHSDWFNWLEDKLAIVAERLPSEILPAYLDHLDAMETILQADSWFHLRARTIALAGAVFK